jgi:2-dehydropantoate 2-reductase
MHYNQRETQWSKLLDPTWYILGAGAIGTLLACKLQRAGLPVALLPRERDRPEQALEWQVDGTARPVQLSCGLPAGERVQRLLVTTKAHQAEAAFRGVREHLAGDCEVLLLHNGLGIYERIGECWSRRSLYLGSITEAAYWEKPGRLVYAGRGETRLGQPGTATPPASLAPLLDAGEGFLWQQDIEQELWRKLIINCVINPLSAIHQCRNGELLERDDWREEAQAVCTELAAVARERGYPELAAACWPEASAVMQATRDNQSSMMRDLQAGRATEIHQITGYLLAQADALGLACPENQRLYRTVVSLESGHSP